MTKGMYPNDLDCVWLALDGRGRIGAFFTGGAGPIPRAVLDSEAYAIDLFEPLIERLPPIAKAEIVVSVPRPDDFVAAAERGLVVYDWVDTHRTRQAESGVYEIVAKPTVYATVQDLPENLATFLDSYKLKHLSFDSSRLSDLERHIEFISARM